MGDQRGVTQIGRPGHRAVIVTDVAEIPAVFDPERGRVLCSIDAFADATGWTLKPQGACRGDVCVPRAMIASALESPDLIDVVGLADLLEIPSAVYVDDDFRCVSIGHSVADRAATMSSDRAPGFSLPTLDGVAFPVAGSDTDADLAASDTHRRKRLLLAFASW